MVRVLLADDHDMVRHCVSRMLAGNPGIEVLGEASDWSEAVSKAEKLRPDVLIFDVHMLAGRDLRPAAADGKLTSRNVKVLGISFANDDEARSLANSVGATEVLDKTHLAKELIPAIIRVAAWTRSAPVCAETTGERR